MKLNLGCGGDVREGWVNVDKYVRKKGIQRWDVRDMPVEPGTVEEIDAIDVLEHIGHREVIKTVTHWATLLKSGGKLRVRCPDVEEQAKAILAGVWGWKIASHMIYGSQDFNGNSHFSCFTLDGLCHLFDTAGLAITSCARIGKATSDLATSDNPNLLVEAVKP